MEYINKVTKELSTLNDVKRQYNASIPAGHAYEDWLPVQQGEFPVVEDGFHVERDGVVEQDGQFFVGWKVVANEPLPA